MSRIPQLRKQRSKHGDRAFVSLGGYRVYLGPWGSRESREEYDRVVAEWLREGRPDPATGDEVTIDEMCDRWWAHAEVYYRAPDGTATSSVAGYKSALRPLRKLYGDTPAAAFGPRRLMTVRQHMIDRDLARSTINQNVHMIRAVFRWAVAEEYVPAEVHQALLAVSSLRRGRSNARETEPVRPVPQAHIDAIERHVSRPVWGLVRLQLATAARPGELLGLRPIDIDMSGKVWTARLSHHKKSHIGRPRVLYFGPVAQSIIREFLDRDVMACMFSPSEGYAELRALGARQRRRRGQPEMPRQTSRRMGDRYTTETYGRAIRRACEAAGVPVWSPNRLRHNAATEIRKRFGIEAAQLLLGHAKCSVTEVYAEKNETQARAIAAKIG